MTRPAKPVRPEPEYLRALATVAMDCELSRLVVGDIVIERSAQAGQTDIDALVAAMTSATNQGMGDGRDPRLEDGAYPDGRAPTFKRTG